MDMADSSRNASLGDADVRLLIGIVAHVEAAIPLSEEEGGEVMRSLLRRLRSDFRTLGLTDSDSAADVGNSARALNLRLRRAIGEQL
jgi:hypothetical protein